MLYQGRGTCGSSKKYCMKNLITIKKREVSMTGSVIGKVRRVERRIHLPDQETIQSLFQMTPYYWKTPAKGKQQLEKLSELDVQTEFDIHVFIREN